MSAAQDTADSGGIMEKSRGRKRGGGVGVRRTMLDEVVVLPSGWRRPDKLSNQLS